MVIIFREKGALTPPPPPHTHTHTHSHTPLPVEGLIDILQNDKRLLNLSVSGCLPSFFLNFKSCNCTARQCSPLRRKIMECSINNPVLSLLEKHLIIGQRPKPANFWAFHWSPRGSLVFIGQHFVATRVVHLPKSTETSLITESDQSGPNHQLLRLCTARTAWSDSDQAVRAVHSCKSCFLSFF